MMSSFNMFLRFCGSGISSSFLYFHLKSILALALTAFMYTSTVCAAASTTNITWTDIVGVTIGSNTITKSAAAGWGNGGAASQEKFTGNGGISFTVTQEGTDSIMVGLSSSNSDAGYASIGYAVYLFMNRIYIFESGAFRGSFGTYLDGDSFSVERTDSTIDYMKNGTAFYTSATTTNAALLADFAIHNSGGAISNVRFNTNQVPALAQISDITVNEGEAVVLNPTATDADGDTLTFSYSGWMTSSSYTTNKTDAGIYTVTVTVNDGILTDSQDVTITVLNTNQAPVLALMNDTAVTAGDTVVLSPTATDADGDVLTFSYSGWMMSNSYTTNNTDAGTHTVTVTVSDGILADTQDVAITVLNTNQAPVLAVSSPIVVNEGVAISLNPTATDADGDTLTFSYSGWMTSSSYTTNKTDAGIYTVTVTVSDGILTDSQDVTITVLNTNQAPVLAISSPIVVNEGEAVVFNPTATDADGDTLTFSYSGWMTSSSYTTNKTDVGTHTVTVTVSDGLLADTHDVTITVLNTNQAPVLGAIVPIIVNEGVAISLNPTATDADGDTLTFSYSGWMTSSSYTTNNTDAGTHTVTVTVSDGILADTQDVAITVLNTNQAPVLAVSSPIIVNEGVAISLNPTATDADGDTLTFSYSGWMTSSSYTTNKTDVGTHTVTVTVSDGLLADTHDVTITVLNTNQAPVLGAIVPIIVNEGVAISLNPTATDADGDVLTFSYSGWMMSNSYTTNNTDAGTHTVTVTVSDGMLADTQDVTITVLNTNQAPVLVVSSPIVVNEGEAVVLNPTATDADGDTLTFSYSGWMTSSSYTTNNTDAGTHTVTVTVSDGSLTDTQNVAVTVSGGQMNASIYDAAASTTNIIWTDIVGVTIGSNTITKSAAAGWGNGGAASQEKFTGNGGISFTVTQEGTDSIMVGLSSSNSDAGYASIGYAVYLFINRIYIFESGAFRGSFGTYLDGDSFSVERTDSTIDYKKNGTVFYTSATTTNAALLADFAIHNSGGAISNVGFNININQVKISWNANTETDLMGYRVYYGTSSGNYGSPISVGKTKTSCALDLARGMTNYFAVTAVDWSGNESLFSSEESYDVP